MKMRLGLVKVIFIILPEFNSLNLTALGAKGNIMTKAELFGNVTEAVTAHFDGEMPEGLGEVLSAHLAPKVGGGSAVNLDEVTRKDDEGNITEILCSTSGAWLPANAETFYEDKSENPRIVGTDGLGLKRQSKAAEKVAKEFNKVKRATIAALTDDILASEDLGEINELKVQLIAAKDSKPDFSEVA